MARMLGARTHQTSSFALCHECKRGDSCRTGSTSRKADRRNEKKRDRTEFRKDLRRGEGI